MTATPTQQDAVEFDDDRDFAESYLRQLRYAHIAAPAGAEHVSDWFDGEEDDGVSVRVLSRDDATWTLERYEAVTVRAMAMQHSDGTVTPWTVMIRATGGVAGSGEARAIAAAIVTAADSTDRLSVVDEGVLNLDKMGADVKYERQQHNRAQLGTDA